jgi:hypothetical protein
MSRSWILPLVGWWFCVLPAAVPADTDTLPMPRAWHEEGCKTYSAAEFEQLLLQLKTERAALQSEWKALLKRSAAAAPKGDNDQIQTQLREALERLKQSRSLPAPPPPRELDLGTPKTDPIPPVAPKADEATTPPKVESVKDLTEGPIDVLSQAHTLFRGRRYEEALASFRLVDLKGKKAESRAPVQYLMAICFLHLGKPDEALSLFRDVANSRGDEKLAGYAQWQLEMLRWQREVQDRVQEYRQRRLGLEKRL